MENSGPEFEPCRADVLCKLLLAPMYCRLSVFLVFKSHVFSDLCSCELFQLHKCTFFYNVTGCVLSLDLELCRHRATLLAVFAHTHTHTRTHTHTHTQLYTCHVHMCIYMPRLNTKHKLAKFCPPL
jgi:hypothetical protein